MMTQAFIQDEENIVNSIDASVQDLHPKYDKD